MTTSISNRDQSAIVDTVTLGSRTVLPVTLIGPGGNYSTSSTVTASNLDIRDLTSTDVVTVTGGTGQTADVKITLDTETVAVGSIAVGTNNIGDVDVASIAAGTNLIGKTASSPDSNTIYAGTTALTPKFATISLAASGDLVVAVVDKKIRVTNFFLLVDGETTITFQSNGADDLTGDIKLLEYQGLSPGYDPTGHFETASGKKLNLVLGTAVNVAGWLKYVEVP